MKLISHIAAGFAVAALAACAAPQPKTTRIDFPTSYVSGYGRTLEGEDLRYHSPLPWVDHSLLVRSLDRRYHILWETAPVPEAFVGDTAVFVLMIGIDVHEQPRQFDLFIGDERVLQFANPEHADTDRIVWSGDQGVRGDFRVTVIDKYGDAMGFLFLSVPRAFWEESRKLQLRVAGETADARTWFMVFKDPLIPGATLQNAPALLRTPGGNRQIVRIDLLYLGEHGRLEMSSPIGGIDSALTLGANRFQLQVAAVDRDTNVPVRMRVDDHQAEATLAVRPVRPLDVYLIHHTHLDIGYTHTQDDVERLQWDHLERALEYGAASEDLPEEARFVWNPEGLWAVESYLERHSAAERERLIDGIRRGWIVLDGLFANLLTGIASSEGLWRGLETSRRLSAVTGVPIESAMLSDIPGFTWGLVPALAQHGIKYLSIGPNFGHRIGHFSEALGDRPFYWESPSGKERVLTWVSGAGYSWFHTGLGYSEITKALDDANVFGYVNQLVEEEYPYDMTYLRYNIGSDNGPPDPNLAEAVRDWNERYASPRLIISSTAETFRAFEDRYGEALPTYRGDLTGYWEDGAQSSARETALIRRTAEHLVQTEALSAMLGRPLPAEELYRAWRLVLLYYEHTWGSWNSVSEPKAEFTIAQWRRKKEFADSAAILAEELRARVLATRTISSPEAQTVEVVNTLSWPRTDIVLVSPQQSKVGAKVLDDAGRQVLSQRLTTGDLAFRAEEVPAFGSRRYTIIPEPGPLPERLTEGSAISNGTIDVRVSPDRGTIVSLTFRGTELVGDSDRGLNEYCYVPDRDPAAVVGAGSAQGGLRERGPLVWSIETRAAAPGTVHGITSEVRLYAGIDRVDVINTIDKALVYDPEAVLYRFPFAIADPEVRIDVPWGSFRPNLEQVPGASKNYLSVERWVDIHNDTVGLTFVAPDVPEIQLGEIRTDAIVAGWLEQLPPSATLYSYVMNNYWETNYRAAQDGYHEFRYSLVPHGPFDEAEVERMARSVGQPLISMMVRPDAPAAGIPFTIDAEHTVVTLVEPLADAEFLVRLYNSSDRPDRVTIRGGRAAAGDDGGLQVFRSDPWGRRLEELEGTTELGAYEVVTMRLGVRGQISGVRASGN